MLTDLVPMVTTRLLKQTEYGTAPPRIFSPAATAIDYLQLKVSAAVKSCDSFVLLSLHHS